MARGILFLKSVRFQANCLNTGNRSIVRFKMLPERKSLILKTFRILTLQKILQVVFFTHYIPLFDSNKLSEKK